MKKVFILFGVLSLSLIAGCQEDKIPITTNSEIARDYFIKGRSLSDRLRYQEAIDNFELALKHDPDFTLANYHMAMLDATPAGRLAHFDKAKNDMKNASWGEQQLVLAMEAGMGGFVKKQIEIVEGLIDKYPDDERARILLGNIYFAQQDYEKAIGIYQKVIGINPDFSQAYNQLGYSYRFLGDYVRAEQAFQKYIKLIPDDPNPYDSYAELLLKMGEYEVSIENYEKALKINPDFTNSYMGLASNYNIKRDYQIARKYLKEFYIRAKTEDQKRLALGAMIVSYVDEGDLDGAMSILNKRFESALAEHDTVLIAGDYNLKGYLCRAQKKTEEALQSFNQARDLIEKSQLPENIKNNFRRGYPYNEARIALMQNDPEQAEADLEKFRAQVEKTESPYQLRLVHELAGQIALEKGEYQRAIEELNQASQQSALNLYRIATAYEHMNDLKDALSYYQQAANFNALMDMDFALIRTDAERKAAELKARIENQ
jgi:tetratricopeptide (TPR) repeat protein